MNPINADLHCHSTVSDGLLKPAELVRRAQGNGVELFSLTDHDEIDGLPEARGEAERLGLPFVNGVEISVSWGDDQTVHIVGLGFDDRYQPLAEGVVKVRSGRDSRAQRIGAELDRAGIHGAYDGALRHAGNPALISRAHFARYIVEAGLARDVKSVFDHWLAKGKPGYVAHPWAILDEALTWIHGAGGLAVIAHPARYRLSRAEIERLYATFKELGGAAVEVISGSHDADDVRECARVARHYGFMASRGSDFHGPEESWLDLGRLPTLPEDLVPVWTKLR
jgi:3',5'-nucleoside bisphosphate phosphatase